MHAATSSKMLMLPYCDNIEAKLNVQLGFTRNKEVSGGFVCWGNASSSAYDWIGRCEWTDLSKSGSLLLLTYVV